MTTAAAAKNEVLMSSTTKKFLLQTQNGQTVNLMTQEPHLIKDKATAKYRASARVWPPFFFGINTTVCSFNITKRVYKIHPYAEVQEFDFTGKTPEIDHMRQQLKNVRTDRSRNLAEDRYFPSG